MNVFAHPEQIMYVFMTVCMHDHHAVEPNFQGDSENGSGNENFVAQ